MYCPSVINSTERSFTVDLAGEVLVHERIERREDVYIIKSDTPASQMRGEFY
jgi:hypothetical protein